MAKLRAVIEQEEMPRLITDINNALSKIIDELLERVCQYDIACLPTENHRCAHFCAERDDRLLH